MRNKTSSRRNFLRSFADKESAPPFATDPLFDKYARKFLSARHYSTGTVANRTNNDDSAGTALRVGNVTSGLGPYAGQWTEWEVLHLLRRTNFGWKKPYVDSLLALDPSSAVDKILQINTTPPPPPVNWYQNVSATSGDENGLPYGADWTNDAFNSTTVGQTSNSYRVQALRRWLFGLAVNNDNTIREKMTWFWYHFIPVDFETVRTSPNTYANTNSARILYRYMKLLRDNALGNYRTLIRAISVEPAMMFYLNNQANSAASPDENFAREQMELFTLGKDPASQYTQNDVVAAARVLTGWRVQNLNTTNVVTNFVASSHSTTNKQFSSFFNNTIINYQSGANGANELDSLLNMIFSKDQVVAQYVCRRLYRYFVYYDIDANIEANVIVPLAQTFINNNWNILPVLQQLFKSEHFFDMANRGVYIKSPFDLLAGTLNMFNVNTTGSNIQNQYNLWSYFNDTVGLGIEQQMGSIPNVSGWNAYYQTPSYHEYWINSNSIQKRFKFINDLFAGFTQSSTTIKIDNIAFIKQFDAATVLDPDLLVAACIKYLLPVDLSQPQKDALKTSSLLGNQLANHYWPDAYNDYLANPTDNAKKGIIDTRVKTLLSGLCQLAEFQLM